MRERLLKLAYRIGPVFNSHMLVHEWLCYKLFGHEYETVRILETAPGCFEIDEQCFRCGHPSSR